MAEKKAQIDIFLENLKKTYPNNYQKIIEGLKHAPRTTFRINRQKGNSEQVHKSLRDEGFTTKPGPIENSYIITNISSRKYISDTQSYISGQIYVQELSSMVPPILLNPKEGEYILDIAAAPGSKTTQIAEMTKNKSFILAIEKHPLRIRTLHHNIKLQNSEKIKVIQGNGIKFDKRNSEFVDFFDKVLVDAPCSTEGRFNLNNSKTYQYWNIHKRKDMSKIQKGLLISGIRMLKPGGTLVYSTCTFGIEENELVMDWLLQKYPELVVEKIDLKSIGIKNYIDGITSWNNKELNAQIKNAMHILPNEYFSGFFAAKFMKPKNFPKPSLEMHADVSSLSKVHHLS